MKVLFLVIAHAQSDLSEAKNIWIENVKSMFPHATVWFLYANPDLTTPKQLNEYVDHADFFCKGNESVYDVTLKTMQAVHMVVEKKERYDFVIRSNLSTLFDLSSLFRWLGHLPKENVLAGPHVGLSYRSHLIVSGTCMIFSWDIFKYLDSIQEALLSSWERVPRDVLDDTLISFFVLYKSGKQVLTKNVKRLDVLDVLLFHKCKPEDNIFCFRFKSSNRAHDMISMRRMHTLLQVGHYSSSALATGWAMAGKEVVDELSNYPSESFMVGGVDQKE